MCKYSNIRNIRIKVDVLVRTGMSANVVLNVLLNTYYINFDNYNCYFMFSHSYVYSNVSLYIFLSLDNSAKNYLCLFVH